MTKRALCIGINNYPGTANDLNGCVNDANDWAEELKGRGFAVDVLLDQAATKKGTIGGIEKLISDSKYGDILVISYSGHGTWVPDENGDEKDFRDEAICPHDIDTGALITDDELHELFLTRERGVRLVMISDSCHSGTLARFAPAIGSDIPEKVRFMSPEIPLRHDALKLELARATDRAARARGLSRSSALLFAGCQDTELSWDASFNGRPNGAFTRVALDVLRAAKPATYHDWFRAIRAKLPSVDYPQTPNLSGTSTQKKWPTLRES